MPGRQMERLVVGLDRTGPQVVDINGAAMVHKLQLGALKIANRQTYTVLILKHVGYLESLASWQRWWWLLRFRPARRFLAL